MPVLVLITRVIHRSTLHFAVPGSTVILEHMEQYHIKIVEKITLILNSEHKAFVESLFLWP